MGAVCQCFQTQNSEETKKSLLTTTKASVSLDSKLSMNNFKVLKVIGKGSFGKVLLVSKKDNSTLYAMKILKKKVVAATNQKDHTKTEREIMESIKSPFIVQLKFAFQTETKLYMAMEYMKGGELFFHLRKCGRFTEERATFYAAEILLALEALHQRNFIYRDLKPENVLLDESGHIKVTDFGLSKSGMKGSKKAFTFCGTPEYLAPEVLRNEGYGKQVDFWSFGALLYEMISGAPPHYSKNRNEMYNNVLNKPIPMKPHFSSAACDLLSKLLQIDPSKRLSKMQEVKAHPFFGRINWSMLQELNLEPPFKPRVSDPLDTRNFDTQFTNQPPEDSFDDKASLNGKNEFRGWTYQESGAFN